MSDFFNGLLQSVKQMDKIMHGEMPPSRRFEFKPDVDVQAVRENTGLTQDEFAQLLRVSVRTLQNWEQHRRTPSGSAAALLTLTAKAPKTVLKTLHT